MRGGRVVAGGRVQALDIAIRDGRIAALGADLPAASAKHVIDARGRVVLPGLVVALVLGIQPLIAHQPDGTPLFFPFGIEITLPAVLLPHLVIGIGEAALTVPIWRYARSRKWCS